ncbi:excalibur calcium-binding domain-containing protein [Brachybacterium hainanense]|uniref:Excalibur calcium-binding domain-containing protein n=1 Tax=Brachybacterium hainanense TaxID=1541174 RepID=A0ABV6RB59_9MICO
MSRPRRDPNRRRKIGILSGLSCLGCGGLALVVLLGLGVIGAVFAPPQPPARVPAASAEPSPSALTTAPEDAVSPTPTADPSTALGALSALPVQERGSKTGYDRDSFGWRQDVDRNGCDTRNDVLRRDLHDIILKRDTQGCVVLTGVLSPSPYSGAEVAFDRDNGAIDIDHVVALSDAWQSGASTWDKATRQQFANDPLNLLAVESELNRQKGDGDAATWLPPSTGHRCEYVALQIAVKAKYGLWVKPAEREAIERVLSTCEGQPAVTAALAWPAPGEGDGAREEPAPPTEAPPTEAPTTEAPTTEAAAPETTTAEPTTEAPVSYASCEEVRAAGKAPIRDGDPGFRAAFDGDGDGVGCESSSTRTSEPARERTSAPEDPEDEAPASYKNCDEVRAAGKAPIRAGDPGFRKKFDRDGDGVGCES